MAELTDKDARGHALDEIQTAIKNDDSTKLGDGLLKLIHLEPRRWREIALLASVFPDSNAKNFQKRLPVFLAALGHVVTAGDLPDLETVQRTILSMLDVGQRLDNIRKRLESSTFFDRSKSTQVYRLAVWLESQSSLLYDAINKTALKGDVYDPVAAMQTSLSTEGASGSVAPVTSWENMADACDLVLRYLFHKHAKAPFGEIDVHDSPYRSPDFTQVTMLAPAWKDLNEIWANVKFNGWLSWTKDGAMFYLPPDKVDLHRRFISIVRNNRFTAQEVSLALLAGPPPSNPEWLIRKIARRVNVPAAGEVWQCVEFNIDSLREASRDTVLLRLVGFYVKHRHYSELVSSLKPGIEGTQVTWAEWLNVRNVLAVICEVVKTASGNQIHDPDEKARRAVAPVERDDLTRLVAAVTTYDEAKARACLDLMVFAAARKGIEIFDQPLLPVSNNRVLLVPCLVISGNPIFSLEHFVANHGDFSSRGIPFEKNLAAALRDRGVPAHADSIVPTDAGSSLNFDLVCWWKNYLILIEAKCVKSEFSGADDFNTRVAVEKSIDQLVIRRDALAGCWKGMRDVMPELGLPYTPPPPDRILCISVTNSMRFNGLTRDAVICTDDFCLLKYFASPLANVYAVGEQTTEIVGTVRNRPDGVDPKGWVEYLRNPPQIRSLSSEVKIGWRRLIQLEEDKTPAVIPTYAYEGSIEKAVKRLGGRISNTGGGSPSRRRKRR